MSNKTVSQIVLGLGIGVILFASNWVVAAGVFLCFIAEEIREGRHDPRR